MGLIKKSLKLNSVVVENKKVIETGNFDELIKKHPKAKVNEELVNKYIYPGFIKPHSHTTYSALLLSHFSPISPDMQYLVSYIPLLEKFGGDKEKTFKAFEALVNNGRNHENNKVSPMHAIKLFTDGVLLDGEVGLSKD
jgi:predicted amidohydrolase YtcJ